MTSKSFRNRRQRRSVSGHHASPSSSFAQIVKAVRTGRLPPDTVAFDPVLKRAVIACLQDPSIGHQRLAPLWISLFLQDPLHRNLRALSGLAEPGAEHMRRIKASLSDPFLLCGLQSLIIFNSEIEGVFKALRALFLELNQQGCLYEGYFPAVAALGMYCAASGYVFAETGEETERIDSIQRRMEKALAGESGPPDMLALALLACYRPLYRLAGRQRLLDIPLSGPRAALIRQQVLQPQEEEQAKIKIRSTLSGATQNATSAAVRTMYEESPYPRWNTIDIPPAPFTGVKGRWLVAGCGTGRALMQAALAFPDVRFTAIDLSLSSLAYAQRQASVYGARNIEFLQADILAPEWAEEKRFDFIECSGVLHHMENPVSGMERLVSVLQSGGAMFIGLYSARARESVLAAQDYAAVQGFKATPEDIRAFRESLRALPPEHPAAGVTKRRDFFTLEECRDLVFHVQEHNYTLPDIRTMLAAQGLEFCGFHLAAAQAGRGYRQTFPEDTDGLDLENWHRLEQENPTLFTGMYQFLCCRKGNRPRLSTTAQRIVETGFFMLHGLFSETGNRGKF